MTHMSTSSLITPNTASSTARSAISSPLPHAAASGTEPPRPGRITCTRQRQERQQCCNVNFVALARQGYASQRCWMVEWHKNQGRNVSSRATAQAMGDHLAVGRWICSKGATTDAVLDAQMGASWLLELGEADRAG